MSAPDMLGYPPGLKPEVQVLALSDLTTTLVTGTNNGYFVAPFAMSLLAVQLALLTASTSGTVTVDVKVAAVSIMSVLPSIDINANTSQGAALPSVIASPDIKAGQLVSFDITVAGTGAKGLQVVVLFVRKP